MTVVDYTLRNRVAMLRLDDAPRRNVLSAALCTALSEAVSKAVADPNARAIVVTGSGSAFCAGADLSDLQAAAGGQFDQLAAVYKSFIDIAVCPLPTLAAVNGAAIGAGFNLALACDMRIASTEAVFDTRFLKLGLHPGGGHAWMLLRAVGWSRASRLLIGGQAVRAAEALQIGLVESVVAGGELLDRSLEIFRTTVVAPRELVARTKATLRMAQFCDQRTAVAHETAEQQWSLGQPGMSAAFTRPLQA